MNRPEGIRTRARILAVEAVDALHRKLVTPDRPLPPWGHRAETGPPELFEATGAEFLAYLKLLARLRPEDRVVDVGSGAGMMALQLRDYLRPPGAYRGLDVNRRLVEWCRSGIPEFEFHHADVANGLYNPQGALAPEEFRLPYDDASADVVVVKSVFTHMRQPAVENYLREAGRVLSDGGRCLASFFLLGEPSRLGTGAAFRFDGGEEGRARFAHADRPEFAIAYPESFVEEAGAAAGLSVTGSWRGTWSGAPGGLSFQDLVLLEPARPSGCG